jgi:hypothetical protein
MALSGAERVKRWREKHRGLHNLRRRNARALVKAGAVTISDRSVRHPEGAEPVVYRDEFGGIISETEWEKLNADKTG